MMLEKKKDGQGEVRTRLNEVGSAALAGPLFRRKKKKKGKNWKIEEVKEEV